MRSKRKEELSMKYAPPAPPNHLSQRAKAIWVELVKKDVVSAGRLALFQTALEALDRGDEARKAVDGEGLLVGTEEGKMRHANPLLKVERDCMTLFARIWGELHLGYLQGVDRRD
jgi:phage terminase small subunit